MDSGNALVVASGGTEAGPEVAVDDPVVQCRASSFPPLQSACFATGGPLRARHGGEKQQHALLKVRRSLGVKGSGDDVVFGRVDDRPETLEAIWEGFRCLESCVGR